MKKYFLYLSIALIVLSCNQDQNQKRVVDSFKQLLDSIMVENLQEAESLAPFLVGISGQERIIVLKSFRELNGEDYKLEILKKSDDLYYLKIEIKNSDSFWSGIILPYQQNTEGQWVMSPIIKSTQTFDIIPAQD